MMPPWGPPPPAPARTWPAVILAVLATLLAVAAVIVVQNHKRSQTPTYTAAQSAEAKGELCHQYELAMSSVRVETNLPNNVALARISLDNASSMLEIAAANPALAANYRDAAAALAAAMRKQTAMGTRGSDPADFAAIDDTNAKISVMKSLCNG